MHYSVHEKTFSLSHEIDVLDDRGNLVYRVHGPLVRAREDVYIDDSAGTELARIKEPLLGNGQAYEIYQGGRCTVRLAMRVTATLLEGIDIQTDDGRSLRAHGDLVRRDYTIDSGPKNAARVSRHGDQSFKIETMPDQDDLLLIMSAIAMALMVAAWARIHNP